MPFAFFFFFIFLFLTVFLRPTFLFPLPKELSGRRNLLLKIKIEANLKLNRKLFVNKIEILPT